MQRNRSIGDDLMTKVPSEEGMSAAEWLAEQMPGGFFIYRADENMELLYVNQSTCEIFGCETVEEFRTLTGNTFRGMVHPEDYDAIRNSIDEQISRESNRRHIDYVVYRIIRKDGSVRWVDDYGHFASLPGYGEVYYVFIEDITEHKLAQEEKERSKNLAAALEQAEQANVAKSAFLSNMSHEIRTPITAILGMNEMIQRETENGVILEYSENIRKAGVSLLGIISDILDFSKIETGKMELDNEEYALTSVVTDLYNLVQFRAEAKGLELHFTLDPKLPSHLYGDEIRVKQIITNILTNAVKYTETGRVDFEMKLEETLPDAVRISVSVSDTGIGIREEDMKRLFEPFDRLDMKKTRSIEGSGLGLAITRQLLSIMGSELEVESRYEEGSRFHFVLTQKVMDWTPIGDYNPGLHMQEASDRRSKHSLFTAPGMRLLVVDDTPMNLQVIAGLLKRTKMHIDVATSGEQCLEKFGSNHYDLVFLDYRMPKMNGIETLSEMRKRYPEEFEKTPVISLTASAVSGDKEKMIRSGFTDYLPKPVNVDEMERMMMKYLPADSLILSDGEGEEEEDEELKKLPEVIFTHPELDAEKGVAYCGDAEDYLFALETFSVSIDEKAAQIEEDLKQENYEAFALAVHSLKSTSGAIGAVALSEKAKALEAAARANETEVLHRDTPALLKDYREMKKTLREILKSAESKEEPAHASLTVVEEERSRMLAKALEEAERINLAKTAFLSNMSHEIRTPMNAIIGLYNIALQKQDLDGETRDLLLRIGTGARHLLSLINDILDMSRIESGHVSLVREVFSFGTMVEQINTMTESQCADKGLVYDCSIIGQVDDYYFGDDMKLKQVLFNILGNAVRYTTSPGSVFFSVEELSRKNQSAMLRFVIRDTGEGIDPEFLPKLFEPFSREAEGTSNRSGSTGLGMAISKNIVTMMEGSIDVASEKGKGTTFTVTVPLGICSRKGEEDELSEPGNVRVLIVDDDVTACEHARMVLRRIGIESEYVLSGEEALVMFENSPPGELPFQLLLVDWKMPEMDGIELTRRIREILGEEGPAIVLTTYNWYEIMEEALRAGVDAFLSKPLFAGNIRSELGKVLAGKKKNRKWPEYIRGLEGRRVLLAEDMEINAQIMKQVLRLKAIRADLVVNGEEAVTRFSQSREGTYDAILMDIRMPKMDGLQATRKIRAMNRPDASTIPIIALTANAFDEDVRLSLEAGMDVHLSKPVEPDALFATLKKIFAERETGKTGGV